jgi:hypothetical protein
MGYICDTQLRYASEYDATVEAGGTSIELILGPDVLSKIVQLTCYYTSF